MPSKEESIQVQLVESLKLYRETRGEIPTKRDYDEDEEFGSSGSYFNYFDGGWNEGLIRAFGYEAVSHRMRFGITYEELTDLPEDELKHKIEDDIRAVNDMIDGHTGERDYQKIGRFPTYRIHELYGSWENAKKEAGVTNLRQSGAILETLKEKSVEEITEKEKTRLEETTEMNWEEIEQLIGA